MSFLSQIFLPARAQTQSEAGANAARLERLAAERLAERQAANTITPEQLDRYQTSIAMGSELESVDRAAAAGFVEGAKEGWNNVLTAPGKALGVVGSQIGTILRAIPLWVWVVALVGAFFYFGGGQVLRVYVLKKVVAK